MRIKKVPNKFMNAAQRVAFIKVVRVFFEEHGSAWMLREALVAALVPCIRIKESKASPWHAVNGLINKELPRLARELRAGIIRRAVNGSSYDAVALLSKEGLAKLSVQEVIEMEQEVIGHRIKKLNKRLGGENSDVGDGEQYAMIGLFGRDRIGMFTSSVIGDAIETQMKKLEEFRDQRRDALEKEKAKALIKGIRNENLGKKVDEVIKEEIEESKKK